MTALIIILSTLVVGLIVGTYVLLSKRNKKKRNKKEEECDMSIEAKRRNLFSNLGDNSFSGGMSIPATETQLLAYNTNHLLSQGRQLIPIFSPDITGSMFVFGPADYAQGYTALSFRLYTLTSTQSIERVWSVSFNSISSSQVGIRVASTDAISAPALSSSITGTEQNVNFFQFIDSSTPILSGTTSHKVHLLLSSSIEVIEGPTSGSKYAPYPVYISCREVDRPRFDPVSSSHEGGVDELSCGYGSTIFASNNSQYSSFAGIARNTQMIRERLNNQCIFTWARPIERNFAVSDEFSFRIDTTSDTTIMKGKARLLPRYKNEQTGSLMTICMGGLSTSTPGWSAHIVVSTSAGVSTASWTGGALFDDLIYGTKFVNVPVFRMNTSSSLGIPTPFGYDLNGSNNTELLDFHIYGYLSGTFSSSDYMNVFTLQGFDMSGY